jgi:hypothetical protein
MAAVETVRGPLDAAALGRVLIASWMTGETIAIDGGQRLGDARLIRGGAAIGV